MPRFQARGVHRPVRQSLEQDGLAVPLSRVLDSGHPGGFPCLSLQMAPNSVANMTCIVPQADHRLGQVMFITHGTHARRAQEEVPAGSRFEAEPSSCEHTQEMPAGKEQHIPRDGPHSAHHVVGPDTNLLRGFSSRTTIPEQLPVGALGVNFNSAAALVITVIPLQQVAIDLGNVPKASQFACSGRAR